MRNIRLTIEYDGTNYAGWQVQRGQEPENKRQKNTIQEALEQALRQILQEKIKVIGSGRTDAGVHARGQIANFKTNSLLGCKKIQDGLNSVLAKDIRVTQIEEVDFDFHARFSAHGKVYRYTIVNNSFVSPFIHRFSYLVKPSLDVKKMRQAAQYLIGKRNFRSFQTTDKKERHPVRTIKRLEIKKNKNLIFLDIEADGFLFRMVRNIVGTLIEIGRGKFKPEQMKEILKAKNRVYAGPCAPAKGLCLMQVQYKSAHPLKN
jgi:tRNA pseudouridine38-40 synthase